MAKLREAEIRARLRQARDETGMSRQTFGDLLQAHPASVEAWESGARGVPYGMMNAWAEATGKSVEWLLHGREPDPETANPGNPGTLEEIRDLLRELRDLLVAATAPVEARDEWVRQVREEIQRQEAQRTPRNGHADPKDPPSEPPRAHEA